MVRSKWLIRREGFTPDHLVVSLPPFHSFIQEMENLLEYGKRGDEALYKGFNWVPLCVGLGFMLFGVLALWPFLLPAKRSGPDMTDRRWR